MDTRNRVRTGAGLMAALAAVVLAGLGLAMVYGFAVEYGGGSFRDLAFLVVPIPLLAALVAVVSWPGVPARRQAAVLAGAAVAMVGGCLAADALGAAESDERALEASRTFSCNGRHSEVLVPAVVDETWRELPREAPLYGPVQGSPTDCTAAVAGDGDQAFADYTGTFRGLDGWRVELDRPRRFVMSRDGVEVTVRLTPDDLTMIRVGVLS